MDPESLYTSPKVQELLKKITGFDLDKILKAKPVAEPEPPTYKLLTDEQLQKVWGNKNLQARISSNNADVLGNL